MKAETIKDCVNKSNYPQLQKNIMNGFIDRAVTKEYRITEDEILINQCEKGKEISEIILSTNEVKIYTVRGEGEWDIKYPFRSIYVNKNGVWQGCNTVSPTFEIAYLIYLQNKYIDSNSDFVRFTMKILGITEPE